MQYSARRTVKAYATASLHGATPSCCNIQHASQRAAETNAKVGKCQSRRSRHRAIIKSLAAATAIAASALTGTYPNIAQASSLGTAGDIIALGLPATAIACEYLIGHGNEATIRYGTTMAAGMSVSAFVESNVSAEDKYSFPGGRALSAFSGALLLHECSGPTWGGIGIALAGFASYAQFAENRARPRDVIGAIVVNEIIHAFFESLPRNPAFSASDDDTRLAEPRAEGVSISIETGDSSVGRSNWTYRAPTGNNFTSQQITHSSSTFQFPPLLDINVGYWFNHRGALMVQVSHSRFIANLPPTASGITALDATNGQYTFSGGVLGRFPITRRMNIEGGIQAGWSFTDIFVNTTNSAISSTTKGFLNGGPIAELTAGISYQLNDTTSLLLHNKLAYSSPSYSLSDGGSLSTSQWTAKTMLGVRYHIF